jgi:hypothetical protein
VPDAGDIASLIRELSDANPPKRDVAAVALFARGSAAVATVLQSWLAIPAFSGLIPRAASGKPNVTVGIAVTPASFDSIRTANGSPPLANVPPDQDAREFELDFPGGVHLDILTTRAPGEDGAIARYLRKFGEGIQQIEIAVKDVDGATEILRSQFALQPVYPATRPGADGTRVNFFLVPVPEGKKVLIELVEV